MCNKKSSLFISCSFFFIASLIAFTGIAQSNNYQIKWSEQSNNASESMPCGGGNIGTNVWVEKGDLLLYIQQSGWFDENNTSLKAGRIRVHLSPNPFAGKDFNQELVLKDGIIKINAGDNKLNAAVLVWVDVANPVVHIKVESNKKISTTVSYESWRYKERELTGKDNNANSWKWAKQVKVIAQKDSIEFMNNSVLFFHRNTDSTIFDYTVKQQGLELIKDQLTNPLKNRMAGGILWGSNLVPSNTVMGKYADTDFKGWQLKSKKPSAVCEIELLLDIATNSDAKDFIASLIQKSLQNNSESNFDATTKWWNLFWQKSFIEINDKKDARVWEAGRNYQLFRYLLACNATGKFPTKFNGGLFTVDPVYTDSSIHSTPDHRNWGGGTFTAQNQRLVYWPMLKTGDVDFMKPQFDFYKNLLTNASLKTKTYWQHSGASFSEQIENFGLPNPAEYGYKRPANFDKGLEYNAWLEYEWDTALEFCYMILETEKYQNKNILEYIPLIENCLQFFDEHYQYLAKQRGSKALDGNGKLILYPGSAGETYKMATNASSTIAALQTVTKALLASAYIAEDRKPYFTALLNRIPAISFRQFDQHITIAPAHNWERINNVESPQLYPVFPWGIYGVGKKGIDTAINTYWYDTLVLKFRSHIGWKQDNIFAARLGLKKEAARLSLLKLQNSNNKFPAFWGPGFDWTPDHNWGGSAMIGLQEMLLQTDDKKIILFAGWPKDWDVHFKLYAPYQTSVEAVLKNGKLISLEVLPKERAKDVMNYLEQ